MGVLASDTLLFDLPPTVSVLDTRIVILGESVKIAFDVKDTSGATISGGSASYSLYDPTGAVVLNAVSVTPTVVNASWIKLSRTITNLEITTVGTWMLVATVTVSGVTRRVKKPLKVVAATS
jgi:hypothetical protein